MKARTWAWGTIQGCITLDPAVVAGARELRTDHFADAVTYEAPEEAVTVHLQQDWLPAIESWWPAVALELLGFEKARGSGELLVTHGVGPHVDEINGPTLILVLYNAGLAFSQGEVRHVTQPGEWFIFNDRIEHDICSNPGPLDNADIYACLSVPLQEFGYADGQR